MALVGDFRQFESFFALYPSLIEAKNYLTQALTIDSVVYKRINALASTTENTRVEFTYELGGNIRAIEQTYPLKPHTEAFYESHKKFVDFQLCVEGAEYFEVGYIKDFIPLTPYDESKDLIIYAKPITPPHRFFFHSGILGIFFPQDVHAGGLTYPIQSHTNAQDTTNTTDLLTQPKKVVLKIPIEYFA